ncbi:hypothetical protein LZ31DRAFT_211564 [Colletotrichum somersetense]|nr:hypothetical protein LZ31DRAFT_211564 [Colletotrichum somersetense]
MALSLFSINIVVNQVIERPPYCLTELSVRNLWESGHRTGTGSWILDTGLDWTTLDLGFTALAGRNNLWEGASQHFCEPTEVIHPGSSIAHSSCTVPPIPRKKDPVILRLFEVALPFSPVGPQQAHPPAKLKLVLHRRAARCVQAQAKSSLEQFGSSTSWPDLCHPLSTWGTDIRSSSPISRLHSRSLLGTCLF